MRKTPCETIFWDFLPALRREFVQAMVKNNLKRKEIAKITGLSEPAISQYLKEKRGKNHHFSEKERRLVEESVKKMGQDQFVLETCRFCIQFNKPKVFCPICPGKL